MDISTSMEIGYILITLISVLFLGGIASITCSLVFQPNAASTSVHTQKKKSTKPKRPEDKQSIISDPLNDHFDDDELVALEINEELFDD